MGIKSCLMAFGVVHCLLNVSRIKLSASQLPTPGPPRRERDGKIRFWRTGGVNPAVELKANASSMASAINMGFFGSQCEEERRVVSGTGTSSRIKRIVIETTVNQKFTPTNLFYTINFTVSLTSKKMSSRPPLRLLQPVLYYFGSLTDSLYS